MMKHKLNIEGIILDTQKDSNTQIIHAQITYSLPNYVFQSKTHCLLLNPTFSDIQLLLLTFIYFYSEQ